MATYEIYGITGYKEHGKDTLAKMVVASNPRFFVTHFADPLKNMSARIFGLSEEQMNHPVLKEAPLPSPVALDDFLDAMREETGLALIPRGKVAISPRQILQFFGTEYVRACQDDYWLQQLLVSIGDHKRVLIADTRFLNEAAFLRGLGGSVIRVHRMDLPASTDMHPSEVEIAKIEADLFVGTRTGTLEMSEKIAELIASNNFPTAVESFDYRKIEVAINAYISGESSQRCNQLLNLHPNDHKTFYRVLDYYAIPRRTRNRVPHRTINGGAQKLCGFCRDWKPLEHYTFTKRTWDGLTKICKTCAETKEFNERGGTAQ
jgi:hypothetical protein